jgi:hypothetical protein
MPLSGTFDTMQLTDVIQWIHTTNQSGTLRKFLHAGIARLK